MNESQDQEINRLLHEQAARMDASPALRARVLHAVRDQAAPRRRLVWPLAAGIVLGALLARWPDWTPGATTGAVASERYVLLLREPSTSRPAALDAPERVAEYAAWAGREAEAGRLELGEKLAAQHYWIGAAPESASVVSGLFVIRAASAAEAERIARDCPHVRHGGSIEIRRIEPT